MSCSRTFIRIGCWINCVRKLSPMNSMNFVDWSLLCCLSSRY